MDLGSPFKVQSEPCVLATAAIASAATAPDVVESEAVESNEPGPASATPTSTGKWCWGILVLAVVAMAGVIVLAARKKRSS